MSLHRAWLFPPLWALIACSAASSGTPANGNSGQDSSSGGTASDSTDAGGAPEAEAASNVDGATQTSPTGTVPAGQSGADAFAMQLCAHEEQCALIDASASTCTTDFEAYYETSGANPWASASSPPPLELYRADYVTALGACIQSAGCGEPLQKTEDNCSAALLTPNDAGTAPVEPTAELATLCNAFAASTCLAPTSSGAQDCTTTLALFNDQALETATSCLAGSDCSTVSTCFAAAFTQP